MRFARLGRHLRINPNRVLYYKEHAQTVTVKQATGRTVQEERSGVVIAFDVSSEMEGGYGAHVMFLPGVTVDDLDEAFAAIDGK